MRSRTGITAFVLSFLSLTAVADLTITTYAGRPGQRARVDGPPSIASYFVPAGIAAGGGGTFYLNDTRTVRKLAADRSVSTVAGKGAFSGPFEGVGAAAFVEPSLYIAFAPDTLYVTNGCRIQQITISTATVRLLTGSAGCGFQDGTAAEAKFFNPRGMTVTADGTLYVADLSNHVIRKVLPDGSVTTLAGLPLSAGFADGTGSTARFNGPIDITHDSSGNLYVADAFNRRIRKITPGGTVTTLAGNSGFGFPADGTGAAANLGTPVGITTDPADNIYFVDAWGFPPSFTTIRKVTPAGVVTTIGTASSTTSVNLGSIAFVDDYIYYTFPELGEVNRMNMLGVVEQYSGIPNPVPGNTNGPRATAEFFQPRGVDMDSTGNLFVVENGNDDVRKIDVAGNVTTFATGFDDPSDVAVDSGDNVYVADTNNHVIWRITPAGVATVFAGTIDQGGYNEGTGAAARFNLPLGIYASGTTIYVADTGNRVIRQIDSLGQTSLVAGLPGQQGTTNGSGFSVRFNETQDVVRDGSGNLYVSDGQAVRKIDTLGNVTNFAGNPAAPGQSDGTGTNATFALTRKIDIDAAGNLWLIDGNLIRKITPAAVVTTENSPTNGLINPTLSSPDGIAATSTGIFIGDTFNHVIRLGQTAIPDRATIDSSTGPVGAPRQLSTNPGTATSWQWYIVRRPANSTATLSSDTVRSPTFTPDVPDLFRFRVIATNASGTSVSEVELTGLPAGAPAISAVKPIFGPTHRATRVHVLGTGFTAGSVVRINGNVVPSTFVSSTELIAFMPAGGPGWQGITLNVTNPDTQNVTFLFNFVRGPGGNDGRADFNGDGREELFWRNWTTGENGIWVMDPANPSVIAATSVLPTVEPDWVPAAFADFNGDGTADIVWRNYFTGENAIWFINNLAFTGGALIESVEDTTWHIGGAADINLDGRADIVWRQYTQATPTPPTGIWFMDGTTRIGSTAVAGVASVNNQIFSVRDFTGDGIADILSYDPAGNNTTITVLNAAGAPTSTANLPAVPTFMRIEAIGDFDGDGDQDIFFRDQINGQTAWWTMNGTTVVSGTFLPTVSDLNMQVAGAARIGSDARSAVLWRNRSTGENAYWYINGSTVSGAFLEPVLDTNWDLLAPR